MNIHEKEILCAPFDLEPNHSRLTMKIENSDEEQIRIKGTRLPLNMIIVYQSINKGLAGHWINLMNKKLQFSHQLVSRVIFTELYYK